MSLFRPSIGLLFNTTTRALPAISSRFYHEKVIDHYEKPRNVGKLDAKKSSVGTGLVGAPACGDVMKLQVFGISNFFPFLKKNLTLLSCNIFF